MAVTPLRCASAPAPLPFELPTPASREDRLQDHRFVLREARAHPLADELGRELDLAETWIKRADRLLMLDDGGEDARLDLYLEAIEGQLVLVRTAFARREAEAKLEAVRAAYEAEAARLGADAATLERARPIEERAR